ncbi:MAG: hypothetical protein J7J96_06340 [Sulfurimonas sp.]|nr:hypothetical protein [Sulfurimonas sp.]
MQEIKLKIEDQNLETVMTILNNLKDGLISNIESNGKTTRPTQYKPKTNTIIREENSGTADTSGKYINPAAYRQRLKKQ